MKIKSLSRCDCLGRRFEKDTIYDFDEETAVKYLKWDKGTFILVEEAESPLSEIRLPNKSVSKFSKKG